MYFFEKAKSVTLFDPNIEVEMNKDYLAWVEQHKLKGKKIKPKITKAAIRKFLKKGSPMTAEEKIEVLIKTALENGYSGFKESIREGFKVSLAKNGYFELWYRDGAEEHLVGQGSGTAYSQPSAEVTPEDIPF